MKERIALAIFALGSFYRECGGLFPWEDVSPDGWLAATIAYLWAFMITIREGE